jgi:hypothetical protein
MKEETCDSLGCALDSSGDWEEMVSAASAAPGSLLEADPLVQRRGLGSDPRHIDATGAYLQGALDEPVVLHHFQQQPVGLQVLREVREKGRNE